MLSAAALMIGATMFAQNNTTSGSQTGTSNVGHAYQAGSLNNANLSQNGTSNNSESNQFGASNLVKVDQVGTLNVSAATQEGGSFNKAYVDQDDLGNKSTIIQGTGMAAVGNWAKVTQSGSTDVLTGNTAMVKQTYDQSKADVKQTGDSNGAKVTQVGKPNQPGAPNGNFPRNEADVDQDGTGNKARVNQESYAVAGAKNMATVNTIGTDNLAIIEQIKTQGNKATVTQDNLFAEAYVYQDSDDNTAKVTQTGNDGDLVSGSGDKAIVHQMGSTGNNAAVNQTSIDPYGDPGSYAEVLQDGSDNKSTVNQSTRGQEAFVHQMGDDNMVNVSQSGYSQYADLYQEGSDHKINLTQGWSQGSAIISQFGNGHSATYTQGGGGNNSLTTLQEDFVGQGALDLTPETQMTPAGY